MGSRLKISFKEFYTRGITHHLKQRKRLKSDILLFVLHTCKNDKLKISPIIAYNTSPMDYAQDAIDRVQPEMYLICSEIWAHNPENKEEFVKNYKWGEIKDMEDKFECISFLAKTMDGKEHHEEMHKIIRKDGKIIDYEKLDMMLYSPKLT